MVTKIENEIKDRLTAAGFKTASTIQVQVGKKIFPASFLETQLVGDTIVDLYELDKPPAKPRTPKTPSKPAPNAGKK